MEDPLIDDHGSSSGSVGNRKAIHRRSDAIAYGNPYQKAAALVDLAEDGDGLPAELLDECRFSRSIKLYFVYNHLNFLWSLNLFAMVVLNFLEIPLWCTKGSKNICHDRQTFYLGELPYLSPSVSFAYEGFTILVLAVQTFFPASYMGRLLFWRNSLNKIKVIFFVLLVGDLLLATLLLTPGSQVYLLIRIAPYIRVMFVILNLRELRDCMMILAGMVRVFLDIMVLWLLFLLASSWLAYVMFEDTSQGKIIFTSYGATLYQMFVLFTTSNNPDVWIPAYKDSRWYCLFFVLFVLVGVYFVTNLILAVVYDSFKDQLAQHILGMDSMRRHNLKLAFSLIDEHGRGYLTKEQCIFLFEELNKYRSLPQISHEDYECIFYELDDSGDFKINVEEFADFCNAISLKFQKETVPSWFEKYPWYHSPYCEKLKAFVRSPTFEYMIVGVLVLNLVAVIIETTLDIENSSAQKLWQKIEFVLGWIYVIEMILKVFSYGFSNYWRVGQNRFDFIVTCVIVLGESTSLIFPLGLPFLSNWEWIRYLLIARILRLIRLLMHVKRYRAFIATFCTLMPSLMPYLGIIFCLLCLYCSLGVQLFGGLIYIGNPKLEGTDLLESDYLVFNFNDYPNGMVTLFNLLVMGNWQDWMQSYVQLTGTSWTIIYFASFYIISVLLLLNMVVSFVLEAFFAEIELESADRDTTKDNQNANSQRRTVSWKGRSGRVDALLHHMLSAELEKTQCD